MLLPRKRFNPKLSVLKLMSKLQFQSMTPAQRVAYANLETTEVSDLVLLCDLELSVRQILDLSDRHKNVGKTHLARFGHRWATVYTPGPGGHAFEFGITALHAAGARRIIQVGICGSLTEKIAIGDLVVAESVYVNDDTAKAHTRKTVLDCKNELLDFTRGAAAKLIPPEVPVHFCRVVSGWTLFGQTHALLTEWAQHGQAVDLETGVLFAMSEELNIESLAIYAVTDDKLRGLDFFTMSDFPMARIFDNGDLLIRAIVQGIKDYNLGKPTRGLPQA